MTYDGITLCIYKNGILMSSTLSNNMQMNVIGNSGISIGLSTQANGNWAPFDGYIDDIAIYNRALTQQEITALYTGNPPCAATSSTTNLTIPSTSLPYSWNGLTFNTAGSQTAHLSNACGADSAATLNLTVTNFVSNTTNKSLKLNSDLSNNSDGYCTIYPVENINPSNTIKSYECSFKLNAPVPAGENIHIWTFKKNPLQYCKQLGFRISSLQCGTQRLWLWNHNCSNVCGPIINVGTWYHSVLTVNGNNVKVYLNGQLVINTSFNLDQIIADSLYIGTAYDGYKFYGSIDNFRVWNRELSQNEILNIYSNCILPDTSSIISEWNFNQGNLNNILNLKTNQHDFYCNQNVTLDSDSGFCNRIVTPPCAATSSTTNLTLPSTSLPYTWNGLTFNTAGSQTAHLTNACGADSAATLNLTVTNTLPSYLPANGLVAWYPFNGNANDESGNGNNGIVNGATLSADRFGAFNKSFNFNSSYIEINNIELPTTGNYSISFWTNPTSYIDGYSVLLELTNQTICNNNPLIGFWNNNLMLTQCGNIYSNVNLGSFNLVQNKWTHYTTCIHSGLMTVYRDGVLIFNGNSIWSNLTTNKLTIGNVGNYGNHNTPYNGKIDDIAIYNRALTQQEITALYTGITNNPNTLTDSSSVAINFPAGISYQAVARDSAGQILANKTLQVRFSLRDSSAEGNIVYAETDSFTTNRLGLFTAIIGNGHAQTNTYAGINWMGKPKFLQIEINQGDGYRLIGTQQLLSVPYSNAAQKAVEAQRIKNPNLPVYSNNAAALQGGLQAGDLYRTSAGDLKVVY
jgi:hypothetical protein